MQWDAVSLVDNFKCKLIEPIRIFEGIIFSEMTMHRDYEESFLILESFKS